MEELDLLLDMLVPDDDDNVTSLFVEDEASAATSSTVLVYLHRDDALVVRIGRGPSGLHAEIVAFVDGTEVPVDAAPGLIGLRAEPTALGPDPWS